MRGEGSCSSDMLVPCYCHCGSVLYFPVQKRRVCLGKDRAHRGAPVPPEGAQGKSWSRLRKKDVALHSHPQSKINTHKPILIQKVQTQREEHVRLPCPPPAVVPLQALAGNTASQVLRKEQWREGSGCVPGEGGGQKVRWCPREAVRIRVGTLQLALNFAFF